MGFHTWGRLLALSAITMNEVKAASNTHVYYNTELIRFCQVFLVLSGIMRAQKSLLTIQFLTVISWYLTVLVSDWQYWVSSQIILQVYVQNLLNEKPSILIE